MHSTLERTASIARDSQLGDDELVLATQRLLREEREISAQWLVQPQSSSQSSCIALDPRSA